MSLYPFLRSPFTDLTGGMFNNQQNPESLCAKFEMNLLDCIDAYGITKAKTRCADYAEDLKECLHKYKQDARMWRMQYERHRQYYTGEREVHYEKTPRGHSW